MVHARIRRGLTALGMATVLALPATTAAASDQSSLRDSLEAVHTAGMPGIQAAVNRGEQAWSAASGVADDRFDLALRPGFHHRVGSITKTFTASAVLRLAGEGRIDLDAAIGEYLPELFPGERGQRVTVRMLLNHTSGINDYDHVLFASYARGSLKDLEANRFRHHTPRELISIGLNQPATGEPGRRWSYSNTNYVITGELLREVTGRSPTHYISNEIIRPLGLRDTYFPGGFPLILGPHSKAYEANYHRADRRGEYSVYNMSWAGTAGALISTPADLNTFYRALLTGKLLDPEMLAEMKSTVPILDAAGNKIGAYGLGLMKLDYGPCGTFWGHNGLVFGMSANSVHSADGRRQLTYGLNLTNYQHLDDSGVPQPHPIDDALNRFIIDAVCGSSATSTLRAESHVPPKLDKLG